MLRKIKRNNTENLLFTHYKSPIKRDFQSLIRRFNNNKLNNQNIDRNNNLNCSKNIRNYNTSRSVTNVSNYNLICKNCYNKRININKISNNFKKPSKKEN